MFFEWDFGINNGELVTDTGKFGLVAQFMCGLPYLTGNDSMDFRGLQGALIAS